MTIQKIAAELIIRHFELLARPGFPTFEEFVEDWVPQELIQHLIELDGGIQGAGATATLEMTYPLFVYMKAGNPSFNIESDLIMSLRDTEIPSLPMDMLRAPFEGFLVNVPRGTFEYPAENVDEIFISNVEGDRFRVVFSQGEFSHYINILADNLEETIAEAIIRTMGQSSNMPASLREKIHAESMYSNYFKTDIFNFAVNLTLYITSPDADMYLDKKRQHEIHQKLQGLKGRRKRELLLSKLQQEKEKKRYIVGANIRLQKEYTATLTDSGKKWVLKHRCRVMGHWRDQPYGPGNTLRKQKWIAPFYKGPTYAEMVEKGYVVR
jgi:hypothetical protein